MCEIDPNIKEHFDEYEKELSLDELLVKAASYCSIYYLEKYLKMGANVNCNWFKTPLYHAVGCDDLKVAEYLILKGADVNNPPGMIATNMELEYNYFENDYRDNPNVKPDLKITKFLLKHGAKLNEWDINGDSPLCLACIFWSIEEIDFLITNGGDINFKNQRGETPLDIAIKRERNKNFIYELEKRGAKTSAEL